ncbi:MAG: dUTP diphosphatase [Candidatus Kariarchaeaceae archaeon]|jgi:dUTP pyrophosphatase
MLSIEQITVKIKLLDPNVKDPLVFAHPTDACADIRSNESIELYPSQIKLVKTGFAMALPEGYEATIRPRSGLALKQGISVLNSPGTIDESYRGEVGVILINHSKEIRIIQKGDRIAQLAIRKVDRIDVFKIVSELDGTDRGKGGFGSTGTK